MLLQFSANAAQLKPCMHSSRTSSRIHKRCLAQSAPLSPMWSSDESADSSNTQPMSQRPWHITTLSAINESTKWTVSATVLAVLLWQHNEYAAWCVVGAVLSSFLCKVLKRVLNHQRPDNAPKADPGMPSSHANSLNFLSVYAALSLGYHTHNSPGALVLAAATVCLGIFKTWLRVFLGFHTWPQVLVGAALGACTAVSWFKLGTGWALPALQQSRTGLGFLYAVTCIGSAAFGFKIITGWWKEQQQKKKQAGGRSRQAVSEEGVQLLLQGQQQDSAATLNGVSGSREQLGSGVEGSTGRAAAPSVPAPTFAA